MPTFDDDDSTWVDQGAVEAEAEDDLIDEEEELGLEQENLEDEEEDAAFDPATPSPDAAYELAGESRGKKPKKDPPAAQPPSRAEELERELREERERERRELEALERGGAGGMHGATPPDVLTTIRGQLQQAQDYLREERVMEGLTKARLDTLHIQKLSAKKQEAVMGFADPALPPPADSRSKNPAQPPLVYVIKHPTRHFARIHFEALGLGKRTQTYAVKIEDLRRFLFPAKRRGSKQQWERYWAMLPETEPQNEYMVVNCLYFIHYGDQGGTVAFDETKPWTKCKDTKKQEEYQFPYRRWASLDHCENYRNANKDVHVKKRYFQLAKQLELQCDQFEQFHKEVPKHDEPFERPMAEMSQTVQRLKAQIEAVFKQHNITGRDYFSWFRRYETRLINHGNQALHRQLKQQNNQFEIMQSRILELERRLRDQQQAAAPQPLTQPPSGAAAAPPAAPVSAADFIRVAADHFQRASPEERAAVNYSSWQSRRTGLVPEALGRLVHHRRWQYTHGMRIGRNEDMVAHYNRQPVPDCLIRESEKSKQYMFVDRLQIDSRLNNALAAISNAAGPVAVSPHLGCTLRYYLAEFLDLILQTSAVDYQDLKTHFLALLAPDSQEDTLVRLLQVAIRGGTYYPPNNRQTSLAHRSSLRGLDGPTESEAVKHHLRNHLNRRHRAYSDPAEYMYSLIDALKHH